MATWVKFRLNFMGNVNSVIYEALLTEKLILEITSEALTNNKQVVVAQLWGNCGVLLLRPQLFHPGGYLPQHWKH